MERTLIFQTVDQVGKEVIISGWVDTIRAHGQIVFIDLKDRSGLIQAVGTKKQLEKIGLQDVVSITGIVKKRPEKMVNPKLKTGSVEIDIKKLTLLSKSSSLPFDMSSDELQVDLPTLLDYRALTLRHPKVKAIFKVQETIVQAFRKAMKEKDFTEFQAPTLVPTATEGGAQVFPV